MKLIQILKVMKICKYNMNKLSFIESRNVDINLMMNVQKCSFSAGHQRRNSVFNKIDFDFNLENLVTSVSNSRKLKLLITYLINFQQGNFLAVAPQPKKLKSSAIKCVTQSFPLSFQQSKYSQPDGRFIHSFISDKIHNFL